MPLSKDRKHYALSTSRQLLIFLHGKAERIKPPSLCGKAQSESENYPPTAAIIGMKRKMGSSYCCDLFMNLSQKFRNLRA